jgi:putative flippase GtrA
MMNTLRKEFAKYLIAGTLAFLSDFAIFLTLTNVVGIHYLIANAAGFCVGLTASYLFVSGGFLASHLWDGDGRISVFLAISLLTLIIGELILLALVEYVTLPPSAAKIVMTGMIFIGNFLLKKFLLFHSKPAN